MLMHFGVIPYLVFDGDYLPRKSLTEAERASKREESRKLGLELLRLGKSSQAYLELRKAVDVTPEMAGQLIEELKKNGLQYVVAPYEADAQLAYLERTGVISAIISEDSDLLVFGAKCLLTKLDQYGDCIEINRKDFTRCRAISLVGWSDTEFRLMAILSGCDYLPSITNLGLKTAYQLVRKYKTIERILRMLAFDGKFQIPAGYLEAFRKAELTFRHQRVFCPLANELVMMTSLGNRPEPEDFAFIGKSVDKSIAIGVSRGDLNPMTKKPLIVGGVVRCTPEKPLLASQTRFGCKISDLKGNKSLDTFFKTQRAPLAELDPNSFTPSPSQQRLLQQSNRTWMSSSAPARPPLPRSGGSLQRTASSSAIVPSEMAVGVGVSNTVPHVSKRRRLCSEHEKEEGSPGKLVSIISTQSRFFNTISDPSSTIKSRKGNRQRKVTDISIWSDDSIEGVMAELEDKPGLHDQRSNSGPRILRDDDNHCGATKTNSKEASERDVIQENCQYYNTSKATTISKTPGSATTAGLASSPKKLARALDVNVRAELASLTTNFSYQPAPRENLLQHEQSGDKPRVTHTKPHLARQGSVTPLQRLQAEAVCRYQSCSGLDGDVRRVYKGSQPPVPPQQVSSTLIDSPLSAFQQFQARGSEDLIIPDSENDSDDAISASEIVTPEKAKPDIAAFAFIE